MQNRTGPRRLEIAGHRRGRFWAPDPVEKPWPELASLRRMFLPLLGAPLAHPMGEGLGVRARESGERAGFPRPREWERVARQRRVRAVGRKQISVVRTVIWALFDSMSGPLQGAESGFLRLSGARTRR